MQTTQSKPLSLTHNSVNEAFIESDLDLLYALDSKYRQDYVASSKRFEKLYDIHKEILYIDEAIRANIKAKKFDEVKRLIDKARTTHPNNPNLKRYLAAYYLDKKEYTQAQTLLLELLQSEHKESDRRLLATAYIAQGKPQKALAYFERAYAKDKSAKTLLPYADLLYNGLKQKEKAKKLLFAHTDFVACDEQVCHKLLEIYQKEQDLLGLLNIAEKLYQKSGKKAFASMILDIYAYQKDDKGAIGFLERTHHDDKALLRYFVSSQKYPKAYKLAHSLYQKSADPFFLAQEAMIEYQSYKTHSTKTLQRIQNKFEKAIQNLDDPSVYNFYGYILIDHDIDIDRGIVLVQKALTKEPNAPYYIDSLAWGYYQKGDYQKAYETILPIMTQVKETEIIQHFKAIKAKAKGSKK